jgi:hypothetical protein
MKRIYKAFCPFFDKRSSGPHICPITSASNSTSRAAAYKPHKAARDGPKYGSADNLKKINSVSLNSLIMIISF